MSRAHVVVRGTAVHVPGLAPDALADVVRVEPDACSAEDAHKVLGRKGLLYKEQATRLALCAAQRALGLPPGRVTTPVPGAERTAVVVSSNLGNLETVCTIAATVRTAGYRDVSPLQTPNASSNVIASTLAIRFGLTGPNVMLCNGATSGADAVRVAARLLRARRADRALVVGVEPDDEISSRLLAQGDDSQEARPLTAAAGALVLERADDPAGEDLLVTSAGVVPPGAGLPAAPVAEPGQLLLVAAGLAPHPHHDGSLVVDLTARIGETYGAHGVLQAALAAAWLRQLPAERRTASAGAVCGNAADGYASLALRRGPAPVAHIPAQQPVAAVLATAGRA
ncbi:beta-ketoacyl synthase N-terminal-like domain-containing protein [Motilibacter deserti]|uniref:Beta-ketoacyl synthase n=1 Tax=Motilibacter deserti TaxID=2714956 RepID=A0ABX0H2X0_9ACTN|nr:beta-ketoacyl synthase N-terminal-like domain-containing protein [Motilibacter deserti]NHC16216.1 beta-ketoacyl synthase [Motilibacter deserti]